MSKFKFDTDKVFEVEVIIDGESKTYNVEYLKTKKQGEIARKMKELKEDDLGQFEYSLELLESLGLPRKAIDELNQEQLEQIIKHATGIDKKKLQK